MKKQRVGILHYSCPPVIGGVETIIENHAKLFKKYGCEVKIIVGKGEKFDRGIPVIHIPEMSSSHVQNIAIQKRLSHGRVTQQFYSFKKALKGKLLRVFKEIDVLFIHNLLSMHFNLALSAALIEIIKEKRLKIKYISWCHDHTFIDPNYSHVSMDSYPWNLIKMYLPGVQYVTISIARQEKVCELYNVKQKDIPIISNGIHAGEFLGLEHETELLLEKYKLLDQHYIFLAPTRIVRRKNIELAIKINAAVKRLFRVKSKLIITGPPDPHNIDSMDYYQFLREVTKQEKNTRDTIFLYDHFVNKKERLLVTKKIIRDLYFISDCLLFPSFQEGFGIPILEAGITKRPVVCSMIPPLSSIGGEDVLKIDPYGDPEMIARKILLFLGRDSTRPMFKKVVHDYYWANIFEKKILPLLKKGKL